MAGIFTDRKTGVKAVFRATESAELPNASVVPLCNVPKNAGQSGAESVACRAKTGKMPKIAYTQPGVKCPAAFLSKIA